MTGEDLAQTQGLSIYSAPQMGFVVCTKLCVSAEALLTEVELVQLSAKPTGEPGPCPRPGSASPHCHVPICWGRWPPWFSM